MAASERWIVNDDHRLSVGQLAATTLRRRFDAVWTKLQAACDMPDHAEHVHQLRVATRRTLAAFDAFHAVIPAKRRAWFEKRLRRLRRSAGEARDLDVLTDRLANDAARARNRLVAMLSKQRRKSRAPIRALLEDLVLLLEVKQRARGNRNNELAFEGDAHGRASVDLILVIASRASGVAIHDF